MELKGFQKTSFIDFPGRISAVVWTAGCNFRCPFCYNRDLVLNPAVLPTVSPEEVLKHLKQERDFIDGLVITGGEPTLQPDLASFLRRIKQAGFLVKLDSNGSHPKRIKKVLAANLVDYLAIDLKAPLVPEKYGHACGLDPANAKTVVGRVTETLKLLFNARITYELRTTVIPGILDEEDFLEIARCCAKIAPANIRPARWVIQNFFPKNTINPDLSNAQPWEADRLARLQKQAAPFFREVLVRSHV